jgi:hypothetical protein
MAAVTSDENDLLKTNEPCGYKLFIDQLFPYISKSFCTTMNYFDIHILILPVHSTAIGWAVETPISSMLQLIFQTN